jgi:hypothetical protein
MGPIIDAIWQLPWYKVLIVAVVDDFAKEEAGKKESNL